MNFGRIFANAIARRVAYVLVAAVIAWLGSTCEARAQAAPGCSQGPYDQGRAYACAAGHVYTCANGPGQFNVLHVNDGNGTGAYRKQYKCPNSSGVYPGTWLDGQQYPYSSGCSSRQPLGRGVAKGVGAGGSACSQGCAFSGGTGAGLSVELGGHTYVLTDGMTPTGDVCSGSETGESLNQEDCTQAGGLTQCMKPDGRHCANASNGKQFCWQPGETGTKKSGNEAATKAPTNAEIKPPKDPPSNQGDWQPNGQGTMSTSGGGTTNNYNLQGWGSSYGKEGKGGGAEGDSDGNGNGGDGDGEGGSASGGGTCDAPPTCSGDAIQCAQLAQLWNLRCASGKGDDNGNGVADVLEGDGDGDTGDGGGEDEVTRWGLGVNTDMLNTENIFGGGSCPQLPSFQIMGASFSSGDIPQWCTLVAVMRAVILLMGAFTAINILLERI